MSKWLKTLIAVILAVIIGVAVYVVSRPNYNITSETWATSMWGADVNASFAEFKNGVFNATVFQPSGDFFGASLIQQGDNPHGWWNLTQAKLRQEITYDIEILDAQPALVIDFVGKRTNPIEWFSNDPSSRGNNIGILLVGDIGLGYYRDNSTARALFIDIWLDNNPQFSTPVHWQGVINVEQDYHSGFPVRNMTEVGKEYQFRFRVDTYIFDSLKYWNLTRFTLKMVQCYIEAKASRASIEVSRIVLST